MLIFVCAFIGLLIGGATGLVLGALVGWALKLCLRNVLRSGLASLQAQFLDTTFAVMGALSKADSVVTREEIRAAEALFDRLHLSPAQREAAKAAFNRGKAPGFDLDAEVDRFARAARGRLFLLQLFLQAELMAVAADGRVHPAEHAMLVRVARRLGLSERDVSQLEALLRAAGQGPFAGDASASAPGPSPRSKLDDAYAALGVTAAATEAEIKRAYRRLMSQNHPDKLASRGLPESMRAIAEEKTRELNAAYDVIKAARGFV
ncbi:MAG TPA: co-chaperone DjlA [Gammaproteobacteria bacterium]